VISSEHRRNDRAFPACVTNLHDRRQFATDDNWARLCAPSEDRGANIVIFEFYDEGGAANKDDVPPDAAA
jgi:hypothetical protein